MSRPPLSRRQGQILGVIRTSVRERGYPPSIRELCKAVGVNSTATIATDLRCMEAGSWIRRLPVGRGIEIIEPEQTYEWGTQAPHRDVVGWQDETSARAHAEQFNQKVVRRVVGPWEEA